MFFFFFAENSYKIDILKYEEKKKRLKFLGHKTFGFDKRCQKTKFNSGHCKYLGCIFEQFQRQRAQSPVQGSLNSN